MAEMTGKDLDYIRATLRPSAVTIVGYSPDSAGSTNLLQRLRRNGFTGPVHLINRRRAERGESGFLPSARAVRGDLGMVYVLLEGPAAVQVVQDLPRRPAGVVIFGAGFTESGRPDLEAELVTWANGAFDGSPVPVYGPQSMGIFSTANGFFGTNAILPERIEQGEVAIVTQSGSLLCTISRTASARNLGLSRAIAVGNGRVTSAFDAAAALLGEADVSVVVVYAEAVPELALLRNLGQVARVEQKPVLLCLGGVSLAGRAAAYSHTGAMATEERVVGAVARHSGLITVRSPEELIWGAEALIDNALRTPEGTGVALIGFTGGGVIVVADELARHGIDLTVPSTDTVDRIRLAVDGHNTTWNPVDGGPALGRPGGVSEITRAYVADPGFGVYLGLAGGGLPPPTRVHELQVEAFAQAVLDGGALGVVGSYVPDESTGAWKIAGLTTARGGNELAAKARILRDWSRLNSPLRSVQDLQDQASEESCQVTF